MRHQDSTDNDPKHDVHSHDLPARHDHRSDPSPSQTDLSAPDQRPRPVAPCGCASPSGGGAAAGAKNALEGEFVGAVTYENCTVGAPEGPSTASGSWRINVHDAKGTARFVILVNDASHVAFTAQLSRVWLDEEATFRGTVMTGAGPLLVTEKREEMTYQIAPYDFTAWGGSKCDAAIYHGTVTTN